MVANQPLIARVSRRFEFSAERAFDAWLDPETARSWLEATEQKVAPGKLVGVDIDARVGGSFRFVYRRDGYEFEHSGTYLEIDRPRRLAFTWAMPSFTPEIGRVTIDITSLERGSQLALTHEMDQTWSPDHVEGAQAGWAIVLNAIDEALSTDTSS